MRKIAIHGLPLNPLSKLEELAGGSFCISYAHRRPRREIDEAIRLVGKDGILMIDNGAYTHWKTTHARIDEAYMDGFEAWANEILARCDNAIAVIPDVIGGTELENDDLINLCWLDWDRCMVVWHLDESIERLLRLCENFNYVAFGSSGKFAVAGTAEWHARIREAFAAIDKWEAECEGAYCRPRLHMMRAKAFAHLYPFDSSDSTNVARNHGRYRKTGPGHIKRFAARVDKKIKDSAGPAAPHEIKRPLLDHVEAREAAARFWIDTLHKIEIANDDEPDLFDRRAA